MITNLQEPMDPKVRRYISELRQQHLADKGDPRDFPDFLDRQGIRVEGWNIIIDDEVLGFIYLKYSNQ